MGGSAEAAGGVSSWVFYDPDQRATFDNDGRVEQLLEITSENHDETYAYTHNEATAIRIVTSVNALAAFSVEQIEGMVLGFAEGGEVLVAHATLLNKLQHAKALLRRMYDASETCELHTAVGKFLEG